MTKQFLRRFAAIVLLLLLPFAAYGGHLVVRGNFHEVIPGELYRSAQPSARQIAAMVETYGIKSIVNLRGRNDRRDWYIEEVAEAQRLGLTHVDFAMSARKVLSVERADELTRILRDIPKPVLIHCMSGADRTGLASVIYLNRVAGVSDRVAEGQLSIWFGHFGVPYLSRTIAMDESWQTIERAAAVHDG